ncbi:hypothetical protein ATO49_24700 [Mycolicibacterium fortuitum subsp. fortuitum DSM 46621 = ATCC 6841 = JCM 6387]|nr:hypothetical protein ATO49_24700 [Mycolicibacterium fortuitum subsp. fortuitum DSM 46621 = ATCC 6841 = JCM 6387]
MASSAVSDSTPVLRTDALWVTLSALARMVFRYSSTAVPVSSSVTASISPRLSVGGEAQHLAHVALHEIGDLLARLVVVGDRHRRRSVLHRHLPEAQAAGDDDSHHQRDDRPRPASCACAHKFTNSSFEAL